MVIAGRVVDNARKASIQGASVSVVNADGMQIAGPVITDHVGGFKFNDPVITLESSVVVSHPLFYPRELPLTGSTSLGSIPMEPKPVVQGRPDDPPPGLEEPEPANKGHYWWLILLAAYLLWPKPKGRRRK